MKTLAVAIAILAVMREDHPLRSTLENIVQMFLQDPFGSYELFTALENLVGVLYPIFRELLGW